MRLHRVVGTLVLLVATALTLVGIGRATAATAQASPARPAVVFGPPAEGAKTILWGETSIDGPALWAGTGTAPKAVLAWTGTDPQHRLNYMTSSDGLRYADKHILGETSLWRPAVFFNASGRGEPYGTIILAWTGTDEQHTLNVEFISTPDNQLVKKFTFWGDNSFTAPAITELNDTTYLAWAGTDANHSLNILPISRTLEVGTKVTLWQWSSISRPDLSYDYVTNAFVFAWTDRNNRLAFAQSPLDISHWSMPTTSPLGELSAWAPSMLGRQVTNMPAHWLAWTGAMQDTAHHLNVQYTESYPNWNNVGSKTTFDETAIAGPELAYAGVNRQVLVSWTGTDDAHTLNVAVIFVNS
jgi:hypothetical protein